MVEHAKGFWLPINFNFRCRKIGKKELRNTIVSERKWHFFLLFCTHTDYISYQIHLLMKQQKLVSFRKLPNGFVFFRMSFGENLFGFSWYVQELFFNCLCLIACVGVHTNLSWTQAQVKEKYFDEKNSAESFGQLGVFDRSFLKLCKVTYNFSVWAFKSTCTKLYIAWCTKNLLLVIPNLTFLTFRFRRKFFRPA